MLHNYAYEVTVARPGGGTYTYRGTYNNLRSESEAIATLRRSYSNIIDYNVWEV